MACTAGALFRQLRIVGANRQLRRVGLERIHRSVFHVQSAPVAATSPRLRSQWKAEGGTRSLVYVLLSELGEVDSVFSESLSVTVSKISRWNEFSAGHC
jgi:hypothetical protein